LHLYQNNLQHSVFFFLKKKGGALKSNDLLSQYIPEAAVIEDDISLEILIYHTSGLPCLFDIAKKKKG